MTINDIYSWLLTTDPINDNDEIRSVWASMASYCYFINAIDFDSTYRDKLKTVLEKSLRYNIKVPDADREKVITMARSIKTQTIDSYIKQFSYEHSQESPTHAS